MATKSTNTQGNPYHDEKTGKFTSSDSSSSSGEVNLNDGAKLFSIRLKPNANLNDAKNDLQKAKLNNSQPQNNNLIGKYKDATSIQEAIAIGKSILPDCLVNYSADCDLTKVNDLNKALSDINNRFPGFVQNGLLNAYGDGVSLSREDLINNIASSALAVIKKDKYFSKLYDEFFNASKSIFNLKDSDKYSNEVLKHFMQIDRNFDVYDYAQNTKGRGGALAYYQVSQDNIYNPSSGGKGINGAIKFYPSILKKATPQEISNNDYMIKAGFHFDYGGHSYTYATGVHELGHSIFTIAFKKCNDEERAELNQILKDGLRKERDEVSGYGHTNFYEQEAEAVADGMCRGDNATPHNKKMMAWLDKVHARLKNNGEI